MTPIRCVSLHSDVITTEKIASQEFETMEEEHEQLSFNISRNMMILHKCPFLKVTII